VFSGKVGSNSQRPVKYDVGGPMSSIRFRVQASVSNIYQKTRLTVNPQYSITRLTIQKIRVLVIFIAQSLLEHRQIRLAHKHTRLHRGTYSDRDALVIANGPSVGRLNTAKVLSAQANEELDVFAMNWFPLSELAQTLAPNFFCLSDPITKPGSKRSYKGRGTEEIWNYLDSRLAIKLILPHNWIKHSQEINNEVEIWIDDRELVGWNRSNSVLRPRGYGSVTAHKTIATALYLGYRNIYLIGLDNSLFKNVEVDKENQIIEKPAHFYDNAESVDIRRQHLYPNGMQSLLYDYSLIFADLKRSFRVGNIFNIDASSVTDAFPKIDSEFID
jgi:hypothetical protein